MKIQPLYLSLSVLLARQHNLIMNDACAANATSIKHDAYWAVTNEIARLIKDHLPSGSGFDNGTTLLTDGSDLRLKPRLKFSTSFHHMDENGYYTVWTHHVVTVDADFDGLRIKVDGANTNDIKDFIADTFHQALTQEVKAWPDAMKPGQFPEPKAQPSLVLDACPACQGTNYEGGAVTIDSGKAYQGCLCHDCQAEWTDIYALTAQEITADPAGGLGEEDE